MSVSEVKYLMASESILLMAATHVILDFHKQTFLA